MSVIYIPGSLSIDELREALKQADAAISEDRARLDNLARGRRYRELGQAARVLSLRAETAEQQRVDLDILMERAKR